MYNPQNAKIVEATGNLPADTIFDGVVVSIQDGTAKNFVTDNGKWEGDLNQPAIEVTAEFMVNGAPLRVRKVFTYKVDENGQMLVSKSSNLSKYYQKYKAFPEVGQKVKIITDKNGFGRIKVD